MKIQDFRKENKPETIFPAEKETIMSSNSINARFPRFPFRLPLLLDGATGTAMMESGMPSGSCPEQWILEHPEPLSLLQKRYIESGADAVLTPTFGANRAVLSRYSLEKETVSINRSLACVSRNAAGNHVLLGGDLSPTGNYLFPVGNTDFDELVSIYTEQASALLSYVDFFFLETNMDLACVRAAVTGIKEISDKPIFVTMTVTKSGKTMSGDTPEACLLTLSELGISAFGLNCSTGPREMLSHLRPLFPLSVSLGIPLIAKPNAGTPSDKNSCSDTVREFSEIGTQMLSCGICILGGCCGTDERHIAALRKDIETFDDTSFPVCTGTDTRYLASTNREIVCIPHELPSPLVPDDDFLDTAQDMADEYGFLYLRLDSREAADVVLESALSLPAPLALSSDSAAASYFHRRFCGKAPLI